jgi:hypothetical protein
MDAVTAKKNAKTPAAILEAFFPEPLKVDNIVLRVASLGDVMLLEKLESPLVENEAGADVEISANDFAAAVFLLSLPFEKAADVFAAGRDEFDRAVLLFAGRVPGNEILKLGQAIKSAIDAAFATVQPMKGEKKTSDPIPASAGD